MGTRFRKSKKIGATRFTVSKKSFGTSFGGKVAGVSFNSKRGARARVSIPGTGVSYTTKLGGSSSAGGHGCLWWLFIGWRWWLIALPARWISNAIKKKRRDADVPAELQREDEDASVLEEVFYVVGANYHSDSFKALAHKNPDWDLSAEDILTQGRSGDGIPQYIYLDGPVELIPDPKENAIMVKVARNVIGYIKQEDSGRVSDILENHKVKSLQGILFGGPFKGVLDDGTVINSDEPNKARVKIRYI